jgi:isoleucyl-tRNA synthetase
MLPGDHVTDDAGTGFVHTAPSHGDDDYAIGQKHGLPMTYNVMEDGSFRPDLPLFGGKAILTPQGKEGDANVAVIEALIAAGKLLARGPAQAFLSALAGARRPRSSTATRRNGSRPSTARWATGRTPTAPRSGERALTSIDQLVTWTPKTGRNRLYSMIEARPDWVLSRQRAWGVPLTCFVRKGASPATRTSC